MVTFEEIKNNEAINTYIRKADQTLSELGFTEHNFAHVGIVAENASYIMETLGYSEREVELVKIAAYLHDIGNLVNRVDHSQSGAVMAFRILDNLHMPAEEICDIVAAIGNHDEGTGIPVNPVAAALILADKSDVRATRVRNRDIATFDIHDRVNYSVSHATLTTDAQNKTVTLSLQIDTQFGSVMDYFEIFLGRMILCRKAAQALGLRFVLVANGQQLL